MTTGKQTILVLLRASDSGRLRTSPRVRAPLVVPTTTEKLLTMTDPNELHLYGYPEGCPACDKLKQLLAEHKLGYTFHPLTPTHPAREALRDLGFATVPQLFDSNWGHIGDYATVKRALEAVATV